MKVGTIVFHPEHRVGVVQMLVGRDALVAFVAADDMWVDLRELESTEHYFQREDYFRKTCPMQMVERTLLDRGALPQHHETPFSRWPINLPAKTRNVFRRIYEPNYYGRDPRDEYGRSDRSIYGRPPLYFGDPRPKGARSVQLKTVYPSISYMTYLVKELCYSNSAAVMLLRNNHSSDRRIANGSDFGADAQAERDKSAHEYSAVGHPDHPYYQASPARRTTTGGGFTKKDVVGAIAMHRRWGDEMASGVFEVIYLRRKLFLVAASLGLEVKTLKRYTNHIRQEIRASKQSSKGQI